MSGPEPSNWAAESGTVHRRRLRFFVGTPDEKVIGEGALIMLCGTKVEPLVEVSTRVSCGTCAAAIETGADRVRP